MVTLDLRFPAGRYHATGWDHHVNEGTVEWPPSPWRILRALVAAAFRAGIGPTEMLPLLTALSAPPVYRVPASTRGHTRHYMPTDTTTTRVFDSFVVVHPEDVLSVSWPNATVDLELLARLTPHVGYLGRAESWVEAQVSSGPLQAPNCVPWDGQEGEVVRLAAPGPIPSVVPGVSKGAKPGTLWDVLCQDTGTLFKEGWSMPPGMRWLDYRHSPAWSPKLQEETRAPAAPILARFRFRTAVSPRMEEALWIGERMREALMARGRDERGVSLPVFSGKDADGAPLRGHTHACYLPFDDDGDGLIDGIHVYSRTGFDGAAVRALQQIRRLWGRDDHELGLLLEGLWTASELDELRGVIPSPATGTACVWRAVNPYVPTRHPHRRGGVWQDSAAEQVVDELVKRGFPRPRVEVWEAPTPWYRYRTERKKGGGSRGSRQGHFFELHFDTPVSGPISLGYGAHFGLGQFVAVW